MSGAEIEFTSHIAEAGYRRVLIRVALLRLRWVLPLAAYFGFAALGRGDTDMAWLWLAMSVGAVLVVIGYSLWASGSPSASKAVYAPVRYTADDEGLVYETESGTGRVTWSQMSRWQHVADHYLLYVGSASYLLVDGPSLEQAGARDSFETLLRECVVRKTWRERAQELLRGE